MPTAAIEEVGEQRGRSQPDPRAKSRRYTNYGIMVNSNMRPKTSEEADRMSNVVRGVMRRLTTTEEIGRLVSFNKRGYWSDSYFESVGGQWAIEIGGDARGQRVHAHWVLRMTHHTNITIHLAPLRERVNELFLEVLSEYPDLAGKFKKARVTIKLLRSAEGYLTKAQPQQPFDPPPKPKQD